MGCSFCVMDLSDPEFAETPTYDNLRGCNSCHKWKALAPLMMRPYEEFEPIVERIKASRPGYNCVLGVSGGLDSTYTAYVAHQAGLKPLLVHLDNGFDTNEAQWNIEMIVAATGWELIKVYVEGREYRDIQRSILEAGVRNMEAPTDHAITALVYKTAIANNLRYVLSGQNWATEGIMPKAWGANNRDLKNIKAIHEVHGTIPMDRFLGMGLFERMIIERFTLKIVKPLNYVNYKRGRAIETLETEWDYMDYGDKHSENSLTRFYQKFILPNRWGIDKRRAHLSALICNGEITRAEALETLAIEPDIYSNMPDDLEFFLEKFGMTIDELSAYIIAPKHEASEYPNDARIIDRLRGIRNRLRRGGIPD